MKNLPNPGDKVYIDLVYETIPAVIISEISGQLYGNPGWTWCVKLIKNDRIFVKAISIFQLTERSTHARIDNVDALPKLGPRKRRYNMWNQYPYFHKSPMQHRKRQDAIKSEKKGPVRKK